ncbi:MAG: polysaccharide deacetylase family protein [Phycisphaerae bacterium]|jgi:peptidoglycan/xylan/chitin deacetylase (PgdA/CDA1 family)
MITLMYHRLVEPKEYNKLEGSERVLSVAVGKFEEQVKYLKESGYTFVTPAEVVDFVKGKMELNGLSALLTFDDGCQSILKAIPILQKYSACATVFVTINDDSFVFNLDHNDDKRLSDKQLADIDGTALNFESHTLTHRPLVALCNDEIYTELAESRKRLEQILGRPIKHLAVPGNWYNKKVMRIAEEVGYETVWYSVPGDIIKGSNLYGLPRLNVDGNWNLDRFIESISQKEIARRRRKTIIKGVPKRLLGPKYWLLIRKKIFRFLKNIA